MARNTTAAMKIAEAAGILRLYGFDDEAQRISEAAESIAMGTVRRAGVADSGQYEGPYGMGSQDR